MAGIANSAVAGLQKVLHVLCKYTSVVYYWKLKFLKTRLLRWKQCGARRKLAGAQSALGAEIYALFKQGETNWEKMPLVRECLKIVEEAEAEVFRAEAAIEDVNSDYLARVERVKAKCSCRCGAEGEEGSEE